MIDVQRLRVFRAVVASGSVQAAADHLGYTPSAVSQQISALQRETGLVLFEKAGRGIAPTASAKVLAAESEELMESLNRLGGVVDHLRDGRTGSLTIGAFSSAAQFWLPRVAKGLRRDFPDLVLDLVLNELGPEPASPSRRDLDITTEDAEADGEAEQHRQRHEHAGHRGSFVPGGVPGSPGRRRRAPETGKSRRPSLAVRGPG